MICGEVESRTFESRKRVGIPLQRSVVEALLEVACELDISFPVGVPDTNKTKKSDDAPFPYETSCLCTTDHCLHRASRDSEKSRY